MTSSLPLMRTVLFLVLPRLLAPPTSTYGQSMPPRIKPPQLDQRITALMDSARIPGLSMTLIRANKVVYSQGYGRTKADSTQRVTPATVFEAASLSKPVFAYAVLQLVE